MSKIILRAKHETIGNSYRNYVVGSVAHSRSMPKVVSRQANAYGIYQTVNELLFDSSIAREGNSIEVELDAELFAVLAKAQANGLSASTANQRQLAIEASRGARLVFKKAK